MFDLLFEWDLLAISLLVEWDFLQIWLLVMGLFFCYGFWLTIKTRREMTRARKALEDLRHWSRKYPGFSAGIYHGREATEISDPILNPKTQRWLKQFWAGHRQNKPPVVDEVIQKEEDHLCSNDDTLRTISGSLIILGLLGTFFGLYKVILPIQRIIENTKDSATITDPAVAAQSMTEMLKDIGGSLSGMEFAFVTSIGGLGCMIVLNFLFAFFVGKKRLVLIDELETCCNEEIAPRFRLFLPETQLEEAVNRAFRSLADRHSEFMAGQEDYIRTTLEAHFENVSATLEPFLETLRDTSETLKAASASSLRVSENWNETLAGFSRMHAKFMADQGNQLKTALEAHFENVSAALAPLLQTLNHASDTLDEASTSYYRVSEHWRETLGVFSRGAEAVRESGENFVKHISNFTKLSEPLEELKAATTKMVEDFDERIAALALTMGETYQVLQKLNPDEPIYQPVFENIKARLDAIHSTEQALLKFQQVADDEDKTGIDEKVEALLKGLSGVESSIENFRDALLENLTVVNQALNDFPEVLRQQKRIIGLLANVEVADRPNRLKRLVGKVKDFFNRIYLV